MPISAWGFLHWKNTNGKGTEENVTGPHEDEAQANASTAQKAEVRCGHASENKNW